jgi:hypothetical protein
MKFSFKIIDNNKNIYANILDSLIPDVTKYMDNGINIIKKNLGSIISRSIFNSAEYSSIISGDLKYELGLIDGASKIDGLINIWTNNIQYSYSRPTVTNNNIKSSFTASMIKSDFSDVLGSDYAIMTDSIRGYSLPWLKWLLLDGTAIIIDNYIVTMGYNKYSRTGGAVMTRTGGAWRVPSQYSGNFDDNWITRSIESSRDEIDNLLIRAFKP